MHRIMTFLLGFAALCAAPALAETYHVAPLGAAVPANPDGSAAKPFASIEAALKSGKVRGGDTLLLQDGHYGAVIIKTNASFDSTVTIRAQNAHKARFDSILLSLDTRNITLQDLAIWPQDPAKGASYLIRAHKTTSNIAVEGLDIRSEAAADKFMNWDAARWEARKYSGILLEGPRSVASRNRLTGIYHGIMITGQDSQITRNIINGYNGDGLRAFSGSTVSMNRVYNCVKTDGNHDDGFQSYAPAGGSVTGLTVDSNIILEWTGAPDHPLRCVLQGIGLFDGFYDNLRISNNLVSVSAPHGISVYGGRNAQIVNNTVVNARGQTSKHPWLMVNRHKNGTPSTNVLVVNNAAMMLNGASDPATRVEFRSNSVIGTPGAVFADPFAFDYRPRPDSGLVDTGDKVAAPARDLLGQPRPGGAAPDRGAYETQGAAAAASITAVLAGDGAIAPVAAAPVSPPPAPVTPPEAEAPAAPAPPPVASLAPVGTPAPPPPPAATNIIRIPVLGWTTTQILDWIKISALGRN